MTATANETATYIDQAGAKRRIPQELINLRLEWLAADRLHARLCQQLPSGRDVLAEVETPMGLLDQLAGVRTELQRITLEIHQHPWWGIVDNRHLADTAMRAAAKALERPGATVPEPGNPPAAQAV